MPTAKEISKYLNELLNINCIEDSSCNGLQVENSVEIKKIGFAVDAFSETFQKAVQANCQMLITHHGLIWYGLKTISGNNYQKIKYLMDNNLSLYSAHLPLDLHPEYGNNIQLAKLLGLQNIINFGYGKHNKPIGFAGETDTTLEKIQQLLKKNKMKTLTLAFGKEKIKKVAIISGGAAYELSEAVDWKADLYITGEPVHHAYIMAREGKINVIFGGHYETEVFGLKALMPLLKEKFKVEVEFIDHPTPF